MQRITKSRMFYVDRCAKFAGILRSRTETIRSQRSHQEPQGKRVTREEGQQGKRVRSIIVAFDLSAPLSHERFKFDRFSAGAHFFHPAVTRMGFFGNGNQAGFAERRRKKKGSTLYLLAIQQHPHRPLLICRPYKL